MFKSIVIAALILSLASASFAGNLTAESGQLPDAYSDKTRIYLKDGLIVLENIPRNIIEKILTMGGKKVILKVKKVDGEKVFLKVEKEEQILLQRK
jgi:hypothetical protein